MFYGFLLPVMSKVWSRKLNYWVSILIVAITLSSRTVKITEGLIREKWTGLFFMPYRWPYQSLKLGEVNRRLKILLKSWKRKWNLSKWLWFRSHGDLLCILLWDLLCKFTFSTEWPEEKNSRMWQVYWKRSNIFRQFKSLLITCWFFWHELLNRNLYFPWEWITILKASP